MQNAGLPAEALAPAMTVTSTSIAYPLFDLQTNHGWLPAAAGREASEVTQPLQSLGAEPHLATSAHVLQSPSYQQNHSLRVTKVSDSRYAIVVSTDR